MAGNIRLISRPLTGWSLYKKSRSVHNRLMRESAAQPVLVKTGMDGPGVDEPIVVYEGTGTTNKSWMMADHQGSIIGYTNTAGAVTDKNTYSMEGVPGDSNVGRFGYTGQMWLEGAELYHYKARAYDPHLGRFLQPDPIGYGDGLNMYAYVGGDAMNRIDPQGTEDEVVTTGTRRRRTRYVPINPYGLWNGRDIIANAIQNGLWGSGGGSGTRSSDEVVSTGEISVGHTYETANVICNDSSQLSEEQQKKVVARFTVPRPSYYLATVPAGPKGRIFSVVDPRLGVRAGFVRATLSPDGFSGQNRTITGAHVFAGTVTRRLVDLDGQLVMLTDGVGTASFLGELRDGINSAMGPGVFDALDAIAARELRRAF